MRQPGFDANPFITSLAGSIEPTSEVVYFTWRKALLGRYDLVHLHWPEDLFRTKKTTIKVLKYILFLFLAMRLKLRSVPVVWTVHNNAPHEGVSHSEKVMLRLCMSMVTKRVFMTVAQQEMSGGDEQSVVIPHGHYKDSYPRLTAVETQGRTTLLYFGFVRRYKGIEKLIDSFGALSSSGSNCRLVIAGRPNPEQYGRELLDSFADVAEIEWLLDFQTRESTSRLFAQADLVVLPYKRMINSGALLLGLSLGKKILAPKNAVTLEIQREVGGEWLHLYEGDLSKADLHQALSNTSGASIAGSPDLSLRNWDLIGTEYNTAYKSAVDIF